MSRKYDNMMKCAQVRSLFNEKQYRNAYEVIRTINLDQVTALTDLNTIADVYMELQKYAEAKGIYLKLYERFPTRRVLYELVYLSLKCGEIEEAEEFYREYETIDKSCDKMILRYYIDKAKGADRQMLIRHLQEIKKVDYIEEWAYELAKLYHKEGMSEACVEECSDIILWFGEGLIVEKAKLLRYHYIEGVDISSESAIIEGTRNLASELRIAAAIAERNQREQEAVQSIWKQMAYEEESYEEECQPEEVEYEEEVAYEEEETYEEEYKPEEVVYEEEVACEEEETYEEEYQSEEVVYEEEVSCEEEETYEEEYQLEEVVYEEEVSCEEGETYEEEYQPEEVEYEEVGCEEEESYGGGFTQEELDALEAAERVQADREAELLYAKSENYVVEPIKEEPKLYKDLQGQSFESDFTPIGKALSEIVDDIKKTKNAGHVAITGSNSAKNIEVGKCFAKELCKKGVLPSSKIAKIHAENLNTINLLDSREQLEGGCLFIEQAGDMSLGSIQSLCQLMRRVKKNMVVILSDTEEQLDRLLSKNRKLSKMIEYDIEN